MVSESLAAGDLAALLVDPARVVDLPPEAMPAILAQLAALQTAVAARLASGPPTTSNREPDRLLTVDQAAQRLAVSKDWLRRRTTLPFVVKLSEGVVRYSAAGIARFIAEHQAR